MEGSELIDFLKNQLQSQKEQNEFLQKTVSSLNENIQVQTETIARLTEEIAELKEKLNKDSHNSSRPPSSDGYKKPKTKSLRQKSDRNAGGQKCHKAANLPAPRKVDEIERHYPEKCQGCPCFEKCRGTVCVQAEKRYAVDVIIKTKVTEHRVYRMNACAMHGGMSRGKFPEGINAFIQYGQNLTSLIVNLSMDGLSADHIHKIIGSMFGIPLSAGTVLNKIEKCASGITPVIERIKERLVKSPVLHFDETGCRVNGKTKWVHSSSSRKFTYLSVHEKRGKEGMDDNGIIPLFRGIAVHDCWKAYWRYPEIRHGICGVHILRELAGIIENYPGQEWAVLFRNMLQELYRLKKAYAGCGRRRLDRCYLDYYSLKYDEFLEQAERENPVPAVTGIKRGRRKKGRVLALAARLKEYKDSLLLFAENFEVPFSNNLAEQTIRNLKSKGKVAGCFRSDDGARWYLKIRSYIDSARKHGVNAFEAIRLAFTGSPETCFGF